MGGLEGRPGPARHVDSFTGTEVVVGATGRDRWRVLADLVALTKPRVVLMVLVTTVVGYYVALPGAPHYAQALHLVLGTLLAAGGAMALNQYRERDVDARMSRTRTRPLPDGRLMPAEALAFGTALGVAGVAYLALCVSALAAVVTGATLVLYVFAYTPLKLRTPLCTLVGAVPGALPPVSGWVAARDDAGVGAWVLFGILFLWQLPHTLAIARLYAADYARAGVRVLPVVDPASPRTERHMVAGSCALLAVSLLPTVTGLTGLIYGSGALVLGTGLTLLALAQARTPSAVGARRVLFASLLYLPALLALLAFDRV
ncbi:MAG: protoheme IX farnesyltransferase [Candidatus Rokubacteria bacterium]|nr:protoheme IX farnesyltransferase [Candidatus Rokubacteria bacterium]